MAANHSTLATIERCISGVPRIVVPDIGVTESEYGLPVFTVRTPSGTISVEASSYGNGLWRCRGRAESLAAHGLLRPDWLPGLPGNNKVSQTFFFGDDGPELFRGNRCGRKFDAEFITIKRVSRTTFLVEVPATTEQSKDIKLAADAWIDRHVHERQAREFECELEQKKIRQMTAPAIEVKDDIQRLVATCKTLVTARLEASPYRFDAAADRGIDEHFKQLLSWIDRGDLQTAVLENLGENVTRLPCRR